MSLFVRRVTALVRGSASNICPVERSTNRRMAVEPGVLTNPAPATGVVLPRHRRGGRLASPFCSPESGVPKPDSIFSAVLPRDPENDGTPILNPRERASPSISVVCRQMKKYQPTSPNIRSTIATTPMYLNVVSWPGILLVERSSKRIISENAVGVAAEFYRPVSNGAQKPVSRAGKREPYRGGTNIAVRRNDEVVGRLGIRSNDGVINMPFVRKSRVAWG